jgi:hypothetical protein
VTFLEQPATKTRTTTRSFRLDSVTISALQDDSRRFRVSVNTLVNQVLQHYVWGDREARYLKLLSELGKEGAH